MEKLAQQQASSFPGSCLRHLRADVKCYVQGILAEGGKEEKVMGHGPREGVRDGLDIFILIYYLRYVFRICCFSRQQLEGKVVLKDKLCSNDTPGIEAIAM
ncbi:hypothetical protein Tco_0620497 [Tanacetum coccineum]